MAVINGLLFILAQRIQIHLLKGIVKQKRDKCRKRHSKVHLKDVQRDIDKKYSPSYLAYYILL